MVKNLKVLWGDKLSVLLQLNRTESTNYLLRTLGVVGVEGFLLDFLYCIGFVISMSALFFNSLDEIIFLRVPELS